MHARVTSSNLLWSDKVPPSKILEEPIKLQQSGDVIKVTWGAWVFNGSRKQARASMQKRNCRQLLTKPSRNLATLVLEKTKVKTDRTR